MTPRQVRSALAGPFAALGFREDKSRFVCDLPELSHHLDVMPVRRLQGCIEIHHQVCAKGDPSLSVEQEVASYGFESDYPRIWSSASVDVGLVLEQVSAVCRAFRTRSDLVHFQSEGMPPGADAERSDATRAGHANTLSASQAARVTDHLAQAILGRDFGRVPRFDGFALWSSNVEIEGFRHLAYVEANETRTLAHVVVLALASRAVAGAFRNDAAMRMLITAPKSVLRSEGRPALLPMHEDCASHAEKVRSALLDYMTAHPPHRLPG